MVDKIQEAVSHLEITDTINDIIDSAAHKAADQTFTGTNTFSKSINSTAINPIMNKLTSADITVAPSSNINTAIIVRDNNDNNLAGFSAVRYTNGIQSTQMTAYNQISGTNKVAYINVYVTPNGNDIADGSTGVKSSIADWGIPSATVDVTYNSTNHSAMNGTTFTNNTGYPCWLFIQTGNKHTGNCTVYAKNISANVESAGMTNAGIVNSQCIPVANGQSCQFFVYVPSGAVSWTATLHRMRGGI